MSFHNRYSLVLTFLVSIILLIILRFHYSISKHIMVSGKSAWILSCIVILSGLAIVFRWPKKLRQLFIHRKHSPSDSISGILPFKTSQYPYTEPDAITVRIGNFQSNSPHTSSVFSIGIVESFKFYFNKNRDVQNKNNIRILQLMNGFGILQVNDDYYGCPERNIDFNVKKFKTDANRPDVTMIELALVRKNSVISESIMQSGKSKIAAKKKYVQSWDYNSFLNSEEMMLFIDSLRKYSRGKPVGFNMPTPNQKNLNEICYAIKKTQVIPDFIVVNALDATPDGHLTKNTANRKALYDYIQLVSSTLRFYKLENHIKVIVKGKVRSAYDLLKFLALGANMVRCVESGNEYENVPAIPAIKDLAKFHYNIITATLKIMSLCGFRNINEVSIGSFIDKLDTLYTTKQQEQLLKNHSL